MTAAGEQLLVSLYRQQRARTLASATPPSNPLRTNFRRFILTSV
jgi:hypothetical protein